MKIISIGFLVLCAWIAFSAYVYVCKVKGLCQVQEAVDIEADIPEDVAADDTLTKPPLQDVAVIPKDIVVYFDFDKSVFTPSSNTDNFILESKAYLEQNSQARLSFTGHTCSIGTDAYNQALGLRRAKSVQQYIKSKGLPAENNIVESKGEKAPADDNNTSAGRANNRRTVVTIIK